MLRNFYLYLERIGKHTEPVLQTDHDEFTNFGICSSGLEGLAEDLVSSIHVNWGAGYSGKVDVHNFAVGLIASYFTTFPLSKPQRRKFEKYLPKEISVNWIEEIKTK